MKKSAIAVRACRPEECPQLLALWREAEATPSPTDSLAALEQLLVAPQARVLIAVRDRRIVGSVIAGWDNHPWAVGFWDSLTGEGYGRDPRIIRYVGTLSPDR